MKCIQAIKETKDFKVGEIRRVDDKTANNLVGNSWKYIPKSEWKVQTRKNKPVEEIQEKKEKKPYKKGEKSEIHKNKKNQ